MWPQLKSLTLLSDVSDKDDERFSAELAECLKHRAAGGTRLGELCIILKFIHVKLKGDTKENERRRKIYQRKLGDLVDKLCFEYLNGF